MLRVALIGSTGYTALEVARCLQRHDQAELTVATSRTDAGKPLADVHPLLSGRCDLRLEPLDANQIAKRADVAMCCLPHGASAESVRQLVEAGVRVVDFSADFRLSSLAVYEHWYGVQHPWPDRVGQVVYGMPEFFAPQIQNADIVANPGCYPTSAIMPLAPLVKADLIATDDLIVDSKSGVSGAGRSPKLGTLYCETNESISAYAVGTHRHRPEIEDLVQRISGQAVHVLFTPHLTPMDRGILSTIYASPSPQAPTDAGELTIALQSALQTAYQDQPFVQVVDHLPATKHVAYTNQVQMTVRVVSGDSAEQRKRIVIVCAIDNLAKGASGAAIQNMNVMFGFDQTLGLD